MSDVVYAEPFNPAAVCGAMARALFGLLLLGLIGDRRVR